jgi:hypothetical protein
MPTPSVYFALKQRTAASLREIHSALDDGLGDLDVTYMDDDELRESHPGVRKINHAALPIVVQSDANLDPDVVRQYHRLP